MMWLIQKLDNNILDYIKNNMHSTLMDKVMVAFTSLGSGGLIWIIISVLLIANKRYRNIEFMALGALLISTILGEVILKHLIQGVRPCAGVPVVSLLINIPLTYSFPSGHTGSSFAAELQYTSSVKYKSTSQLV